MDKFRITGGRAINGRVAISGAKNSALPCLAAALLTPETVTLHNVPYVRDCLDAASPAGRLGRDRACPAIAHAKITARNTRDVRGAV